MFRSRFSNDFLGSLIARGMLHQNADGEGGGGSAGGPPVGDPPVGDPPVGDPPVGDPPKDLEPKISENEAKLLKEVMDKKKTIADTKRAKEQSDAELSLLKGALGDLSVEDISSLIKGKKDAEIKDAEDKGEYTRIVDTMKSENQQIVDALKEELREANDKLAGAVVKIEDMSVGRQFSESSYILENSALPPSIARKEFGLNFDTVDGVVIGYDKPRGAAERTPIVDAAGEPKPFNEAIQSLFEKHPDMKSIIKAKAKQGAKSATDSSLPGKEPSDQAPRSSISKISAGLSKA
jgi:hypothetical protein